MGQLAGDSLGQLVEFTTPQAIRNNYPAGCRDLADGGTWDLLAGQPTDDSELALMLARMLVKEGRYDEQAALAAYCHWINSAPFDVGGTTRAALSYHEPDQTLPANGSLMRISPLGIFGAGRPKQAAQWARQDSRLTHPHPICQDCCALFVTAIATAIGTSCSPQECYEVTLAQADDLDAHLNVRLVLAGAKDGPPNDYLRHMGWVLIAFHNAFYQLLHAPNLEEGIVRGTLHHLLERLSVRG